MLDGCDATASCLLITLGNIFKIKGLSVLQLFLFSADFTSEGRDTGVLPAFSP